MSKIGLRAAGRLAVELGTERYAALDNLNGQTTPGQNPRLSVVTPIATIALVGILQPDQAAPLWRDVQARASAFVVIARFCPVGLRLLGKS